MEQRGASGVSIAPQEQSAPSYCILWICVPNYFDDFVNLEADVLLANADAAIARLMEIIGWDGRSKEETRSSLSR